MWAFSIGFTRGLWRRAWIGIDRPPIEEKSV
jgi:hypothetical protein